MSNIIDGKALAQKREELLKWRIKKLKVTPKVLSILVGEDPASVLYVNLKKKKAESLGINFEINHFKEDEDYSEVAQLIIRRNKNESYTGTMVQLPLPVSFLGERDIKKFLNLIAPKKDIDGLRDHSKYLPAAAKAVMTIIEEEKIEIKGKYCVVVGASDLVGKPIARELEKLGGAVKILDSSVKDLKPFTQFADILVSATGVGGLITGEMVQEGVVAIDVGILVESKRKEGEKVVGDLDFESVSKKASKITPVPGGVGPLTVASLMENIVMSCETWQNK